MYYKAHKCESTICQCFEVGRVLEQIDCMTYYQVHNAAKEAFVFSFSYIRNGCEGRVNRKRKKFINKALPNTLDAKAKGHGIKKGWPTAPPKHGAFSDGCSRWTYPPTAPPILLTYEKTKISEHQDISRIFKFPTVHGVRGVNNAPPSANKREKSNVHKDAYSKNQIASIAV